MHGHKVKKLYPRKCGLRMSTGAENGWCMLEMPHSIWKSDTLLTRNLGVAGGSKYIRNNIFFKFASDNRYEPSTNRHSSYATCTPCCYPHLRALVLSMTRTLLSLVLILRYLGACMVGMPMQQRREARNFCRRLRYIWPSFQSSLKTTCKRTHV